MVYLFPRLERKVQEFSPLLFIAKCLVPTTSWTINKYLLSEWITHQVIFLVLIKNISRIWQFFTTSRAITLLWATIISDLEYHRSLLAGLSASDLSSTRQIHPSEYKFNHSTSWFKTFPWFPILLNSLWSSMWSGPLLPAWFHLLPFTPWLTAPATLDYLIFHKPFNSTSSSESLLSLGCFFSK